MIAPGPLRLLAPALALLVLTPAADVRAESPRSVLLTASDLAAGRPVDVPADGEYAVKLWSPSGRAWTLAVDGNRLAFTPAGDRADAAGWARVGSARLSADGPVRLAFDRPDGGEPAGDEAKKPRPPAPLPALVLLTPAPDFEPSAALDVIASRPGAAGPTADARRATIRTNQQGAEFRPPETPDAWRSRARAVREQLLVTLGLWPMFPKTPMAAEVVGTIERDDYVIERVVLETLPGFYLGGNVYRPKGREGRLPAVLSPHGHWEDGRVNEHVQMRCIRWAKLGAVVFMYDMVGYNDSKPFGHAFLNDRLRRWGLSLATLQTWNSIRALDYLSARPDVDPARIGCTGESGGGTQTFLLTAIDPRIKVSAPVVMVSDGFQGGCVCENAAGLRHETDNVEFAALCAPRPLKLVGATGDWTSRTMSRAYPAISGVYRLLGVPERVEAEVFDFPHNYNETSRNAVYAFMGRWLLGIDDPSSTREGEQSIEDPEDLHAFNESHPLPASAKTAEQLEEELVGLMGRQLDRLAPTTASAPWEASRALLGTAHRVRVGLDGASADGLEVVEARRVERDGLAIVQVLVGRPGSGERIPVVRITPRDANGRATVVSVDRGRAGLVEADGSFRPLVRALLDRGQSVIGFDPFLVGESLDPESPAARRPEAVHFETYNRSLAADRIRDLATVLAWAQSRPDIREVSLAAEGESGVLALLARPALGGLARTAVDLGGFSFGDGSGEVPPGLDLPGVLQFGGPAAAAALCAPAPLRIAGAPADFAREWPERAYALDDARGLVRVETEPADPAALAAWIDGGE